MATPRKAATKTVKTTAAKKADTFTSEVRKGIVLNFEVTEYVAPEHKGGRPKEANPYQVGIDKAVELKATDPTKQITVVIPKADIDSHKRWVRIGMNEKGFSAGTSVAEIEGDEVNVRFSFRAKDKVTRTRKTAEEKAAEAAAAAAK